VSGKTVRAASNTRQSAHVTRTPHPNGQLGAHATRTSVLASSALVASFSSTSESNMARVCAATSAERQKGCPAGGSTSRDGAPLASSPSRLHPAGSGGAPAGMQAASMGDAASVVHQRGPLKSSRTGVKRDDAMAATDGRWRSGARRRRRGTPAAAPARARAALGGRWAGAVAWAAARPCGWERD
jgi:hypothetical protein